MNKRMLYHICLPAIVGIAVLILSVIFITGRSKMPEEPAPTTLPPTEESTTLPPETTTEPPPANSYTADDFATDENGFLTCITAPYMQGVDVSEYQGDIDWEAVRDAGIEFAIIRVGFRGYGEAGRLVEDETARVNLQNALDAGLKVGAYFFSQATNTREAIQEAQFALSILQGYQIEMPVVFDWEYVGEDARTAQTDAETVTACTLAFCETVALAGYKPMFYSNQNLTDSHFDLHSLTEYPMWLAMYDTHMDYPHRLYMWQYTSEGKIPGIEGTVDLNIYLPEQRDTAVFSED